MATTIPVTIIPPNTWVDLYADTSIVVGTLLNIQNIGSSEVQLTESVGEPSGITGVYLLPVRDFIENTAANVGAWAFSQTGSVVQVNS